MKFDKNKAAKFQKEFPIAVGTPKIISSLKALKSNGIFFEE